MAPTDILWTNVKLPSCTGDDRRRSLAREHPEADWAVSTSVCSGSRSTCHYTCNAHAACLFSMRPVFVRSAAFGSFSQIVAPPGGFKTMSLLFSRSALQGPCTDSSPRRYCYDTSGLVMSGAGCIRGAPQRIPANPETTLRLGIFTTDADCAITGVLWLFSPTNNPIEVDFLHRSASSPLPGSSIETTVRPCPSPLLSLTASVNSADKTTPN